MESALLPTSLPNPTSNSTLSTNGFVSFLDKQRLKAMAKVTAKTQAAIDDEYVRYCSEDVDWAEDPIEWWLRPVQQAKYPNLCRMAINVLSIPAMSADVERLFSSAGLTLSNRRNRMGTELLESLECLKSWMKIENFDLDQEIEQGRFDNRASYGSQSSEGSGSQGSQESLESWE